MHAGEAHTVLEDDAVYGAFLYKVLHSRYMCLYWSIGHALCSQLVVEVATSPALLFLGVSMLVLLEILS